MTIFSLSIHNNRGGSAFTKELIDSIYTALEDRGLIGRVLSGEYEICWEGEPGEELDFHPAEFSYANPDERIVEISKMFPGCSFCLRSVDEWLTYPITTYFSNGASESRETLKEWYSDLW